MLSTNTCFIGYSTLLFIELPEIANLYNPQTKGLKNDSPLNGNVNYLMVESVPKHCVLTNSLYILQESHCNGNSFCIYNHVLFLLINTI